MKKTIALLLSFTLMLCLVLTGCGQTALQQEVDISDLPGYNFDTGDAVIMSGANNPGGYTDVTNGNDETIPDGAAEWEANHRGAQNADGTYTWRVGSYKITTRINVMQYIDGKIWRISDMLAALGWNLDAGTYAATNPLTFRIDNTQGQHISFSSTGNYLSAILVYLAGDQNPHTFTFPSSALSDYTLKDSDFTISFEGIVAFVYACEHLSQNPAADPFAKLEESAQESASSSSEIQAEKADNSSSSDGQHSPFYGVWVFASKKRSECESIVKELKSKSLSADIYVTTDWSNLNKEKWYVVSAGTYSTQEKAERALSGVQAAGYGNAYVKYSGKWKS